MERAVQELRSFLNEKMQLVSLPARHKKKLAAYYYLAGKLEAGRQYTEAEINDILDQWTVFHDPATLRREMYNKRLLHRTRDGGRYWKEEETPSLEKLIEEYI
ncbi:MAG: DUF2087 domain-containing protein [Oscillibacter sp.]|nr:DUF2087 domain-containing protein [Oscillibacter sp.]